MHQLTLFLAEVAPDATYYSAWDKVGTVAVCVMMMGVLVLVLRALMKRADLISDKHMQFVESQTKVLTDLTASHETAKEAAQSMHRRLDGILSCRRAGCPMKRLFVSPEDPPAGG